MTDSVHTYIYDVLNDAYISTNSATSSSISNIHVINSTNSTANTATASTSGGMYLDRDRFLTNPIPDILRPDKKMEILMKDGTIIKIDENLNHTILDQNAKVIYKGNRIREFNKYINASDLLEQFITDMGKLGAKQSNILSTPIEIFINWLILKAAQQDGDTLPEPPKLIRKPKCKLCGKFILQQLADKGFNFCNPSHSETYFLQLTGH